MHELVSTSWLKQNLGNKDLILLDASMSATAEGNQSEFHGKTIPTARNFDLKSNFSDSNSSLPNTVPPKKQFEQECQKLGIYWSSQLVVFDNLGIYSSPRVWWLFKVMGHEQVAVLNGGLPAWIAAGFETERVVEQPYKPGDFKASINEHLIVKFTDIQNNLKEKTFTIIDARSEGRFNGTSEEPRKTLKSGHIAGSVNIPYQEVLNKGHYKSQEDLRALFEQKCNAEDQLVFSCGSGLTACIVLLASEIAFKTSRFVYDGSCTEWAEKNELKT